MDRLRTREDFEVSLATASNAQGRIRLAGLSFTAFNRTTGQPGRNACDLNPNRSLDKLMQRLGKLAPFTGAVLAQLLCYILGNVADPTFGEVKSNDANRVAVLSFQQILDDGVEIGIFNVCLAPGTTHSAEVIEDQINIPVDTGGYRW